MDLSSRVVRRRDWEIENVVVAVDQRRSGVGSSSIRELLQMAHKQAATSVLLEVRESNLRCPATL